VKPGDLVVSETEVEDIVEEHRRFSPGKSKIVAPDLDELPARA
jgi:hypothetical protein